MAKKNVRVRSHTRKVNGKIIKVRSHARTVDRSRVKKSSKNITEEEKIYTWDDFRRVLDVSSWEIGFAMACMSYNYDNLKRSVSPKELWDKDPQRFYDTFVEYIEPFNHSFKYINERIMHKHYLI